ncbi:MAG: SDR family NAD(P)-dependent oxidoreductase [Granulosicoccaceae bacterium]
MTGGTQGLGEAIASQFAESGIVGIAKCGRNLPNGRVVAKQITNDAQCPVQFVQADTEIVANCRNVIVEVTHAVAFLASDDSGMMTGSVINYNQFVWGGYSFAPPTAVGTLSID